MLLTAWLCVSCLDKRVYDHYEATTATGWEKTDNVEFFVPPMRQSGIYDFVLGMRTTGSYPFMSISLVVKTEIVGRTTKRDTLQCQLVNSRGHIRGQGIGYYQYDFHISTLKLHKGDSLNISVQHDMKREILPGISDVGIRITGL